ncbi:hypothetical protein [Natrialbaceae archaeon AArc-T1-2]|nr:hypothetical protein [Natrialbaceae archaeon AArc-T1-2]WIV66118.1 hypothetical protein QQ977_10480 [Natrialbaceae archaeon AArc-T1-2]
MLIVASVHSRGPVPATDGRASRATVTGTDVPNEDGIDEGTNWRIA